MSTATISKSSNDCLQLLQDLSNNPGRLARFEGIEESLIDSTGRFRVWAGNVGSLQDGRVPTSLEHRLHAMPKLNRAFVDLLEELKEELCTGMTFQCIPEGQRTSVLTTRPSQVSPRRIRYRIRVSPRLDHDRWVRRGRGRGRCR